MVGAAIKGVSKLLKRKKLLRGKKKPKPRYAKKGSQQFLNRRAIVAGAEAPKSQTIGTLGTYGTGVAAGAGATYLGMKSKGKASKSAKAAEAKLKKAADKKIAADKKKKESYGKRAPKKDKNYGGR